MQKYDIGRQRKAYLAIDELYRKGFKGMKMNDVRGVLSRSKTKWPKNYRMQLFESNRQIKAYLAIN